MRIHRVANPLPEEEHRFRSTTGRSEALFALGARTARRKLLNSRLLSHIVYFRNVRKLKHSVKAATEPQPIGGAQRGNGSPYHDATRQNELLNRLRLRGEMEFFHHECRDHRRAGALAFGAANAF